MVNNTVYQFVGSNLRVEIFLKNREHQKNGAFFEIEERDFSVYFALGFQENSIYTLHLFLAKILQNYKRFVQKFGQLAATSFKQ